VDDGEAAVREITGFYRVFHSSRIIGDNLVFRLKRGLTEAQVQDTQERFEDILKGPLDQAPGPVPQEASEYPDLPRLIVPFNRSSYSRLRRLIDHVNDLGTGPTVPEPSPTPSESSPPDAPRD
jgi:hypothetical protein